MKNILKTFLLSACSVMALSSCSDWTDTEIKDPADLTKTNKSEAYYAQLREYKKSDHQAGSETGPVAALYLKTHLPDCLTAPISFLFGATGKIRRRPNCVIFVSYNKPKVRKLLSVSSSST